MYSSEATFPARFAELVYLIAHRPDAVAERQNVLNAAVVAIASGDASLTTGQLNVDLLDEAQSADGVQLHELVTRMSAHSAHQIDIMSNAPPHEILGVATILAGEAHSNDDGAAFDEKLVKLGPTCVEVHLGRSGFVRTGGLTPTASPSVVSPSTRTATPVRSAAIAPGSGALTLGASLVPPGVPEMRPVPGVPTIRDESVRMIEGAIRTKTLAAMSDDELIDQLRTRVTNQNAMRLLDELATVAEARADEGRWEVVARIFDALVRNERGAERNADLRRA